MKVEHAPNKCYDTTCGEKVWKSRNIATCTCVIRASADGEDLEVLAVKRGKDVTNSGQYCLPCGYLDWGEDVQGAAVRELFEEANFKIDPKELEFYQIDSDPNKTLQNVTIHFCTFTVEDVESYTPKDFGEVEEILWIGVKDVADYDWAFDHKTRIAGLIKQRA